jgi:hypothetical protein
VADTDTVGSAYLEQKLPSKIGKMRARDFFCNLGILYGGLGISKMQFFYHKITFFSDVIFLTMVLKTLDPEPDPDPDPEIRKNAGSRSALTQCGS